METSSPAPVLPASLAGTLLHMPQLLEDSWPCAQVRELPLLTRMSVRSHEQLDTGSPSLLHYVNVHTIQQLQESDIHGSMLLYFPRQRLGNTSLYWIDIT